jgi:biopolymer transport protein TolQ
VPGNSSLNASVVELVLNAGPVAKFILILLGVFSVVCWALIVEKWWEFRKVHGESMRFLKVFREGRRLAAIYVGARRHRESPLAQLYVAGCQEAAGGVAGGEMFEHALAEAEDGLPPSRLEAVDRAMRRAASVEVSRMERYLPFLATTASAAPFIGAFHGIGQQGSASLAVVAPGISEALIATAAGLGAAIPAVMGYNFFVNRVKHWAAEMEGFTLDFLNLLSRPVPKTAISVKDGV